MLSQYLSYVLIFFIYASIPALLLYHKFRPKKKMPILKRKIWAHFIHAKNKRRWAVLCRDKYGLFLMLEYGVWGYGAVRYYNRSGILCVKDSNTNKLIYKGDGGYKVITRSNVDL